MKPKNFILLVLIVAIIGVGLWWRTQATSVPAKVAAASLAAKPTVSPESQYPIDLKSSTLHPPPTRPMAPPPAQPHSSQPPDMATPTPASTADPQADLKTALPDIARLMRTSGEVAAMQKYWLPEELAKINPQMLQRMETLDQTPQRQQVIESMAQAIEAIEDKTPTFNTTGDEATYTLSRTLTNPVTGEIKNFSDPMVFVKINGRWYEKPSSQGN